MNILFVTDAVWYQIKHDMAAVGFVLRQEGNQRRFEKANENGYPDPKPYEPETVQHFQCEDIRLGDTEAACRVHTGS